MPTEDSTPTIQYRDIEGFPGYRVGDDGSVWSRRAAVGKGRGAGKGLVAVMGDAWRSMRGTIHHGGYRQVSLRANGALRTLTVHRLVLIAFKGRCPGGMEACHGNGDRTDNRLVNLRWGTSKENHADRVIHGTVPMGASHPSAKLTADQVRRIREACSGGVTQREVAHCFGVSPSTVGMIMAGRIWRERRT